MKQDISFLYLRFTTLFSKYLLDLLEDDGINEMINRYILYKNSGGKRIFNDIENILMEKNINYVCN